MPLRLATCPHLSPFFHDDEPLVAAFAARGVEAIGVPWQDVDGDDPVAIRSTWDYTLHVDAFRQWMDHLDRAGTPVVNPTRILRDNMDKRYLLRLQEQGHPIVPTRLLDRFDAASVANIAGDEGWDVAVAKPTIGAGAEGLVTVTSQGRAAGFDVSGNTWGTFSATPDGPVLVQPRLESIQRGEWSLIYFGGEFSHAVLKRPKHGDIRVQEEHGATSAAATPPEHVRRAADAIMADQDATVARVDGVDDPSGFLLMELELIEPELFFRYHPASVARYVDAVLGAIQ